ncbi:hypothetical protein ACIAN7_19495, partial [Acinetobacter baumannii]|uniref:hypothetical protein n=1 Tax=Acinetobacter baumannii TaxID=470 RepID=UPI00379570AB
LEKTAYLFIDDLHRENIDSGPLTESQQQWLSRRAILYGMLLRFENKDRTEVWFDSFAKAGHSVEPNTLEVAYVASGSIQGYLQLEYILD